MTLLFVLLENCLYICTEINFISMETENKHVRAMNDKEFLTWIYEHMKNVLQEDENVDYMIRFKNIIDSMNTHVQPEYSHIESVYQCGKKSRWNIGDTVAYYEFYSDREGECVLGKVTKVEFDEEQCDWFYTFEDGRVCCEQSLLEDEAYKKN